MLYMAYKAQQVYILDGGTIKWNERSEAKDLKLSPPFTGFEKERNVVDCSYPFRAFFYVLLVTALHVVCLPAHLLALLPF